MESQSDSMMKQAEVRALLQEWMREQPPLSLEEIKKILEESQKEKLQSLTE